MVRLATDERPLFAPGEQSSYSNSNYVLLGLIVEELTGQRLDQVLQKRVFDPAGMGDTSMSPGRVAEAPLVRGYQGRRDVTFEDMSMGWGAGAVVSSARDVDRFLHALTTGFLLNAASVEDMRTWRGDLVNLGGVAYGLGLGEADPSLRRGDGRALGRAAAGFATEA